jgi:GAF domain-containing protein
LTTAAFTSERIKTLEILTSQAAISLENARLYAEMKREASERRRSEEALRESEQELRRLNERLEDYSRNLEQKVAERTHEIERRQRVAESLRDILAILNSNRPLDEVLSYIVAEAGRLLDSDTSAIYRLDALHDQFLLQSSQGLSAGELSRSGLPEPLRMAIRKGQLLAISGLDEGEFIDVPGLAEAREGLPGNQALLAVPLWINEEIYGCLVLFFDDVRPFSKEGLPLSAATGAGQ